MKKITVIFIAILLVILAVKLKDSFSISKGSSLETKENNNGPVSVAVTPQSLEEGLTTWDFDIVLNTHSEELSSDLVAVSELMDERGNSYKPTSWEGSPPGGHHREGVLKFNPISLKSKSLELKIKNIGGVIERSFKWIF